jgi:hypothetical protein
MFNYKVSTIYCSAGLPPDCINTLNAELNPICHLLALLGAHHILHVSRMRVNKRQYIRKIYIYISLGSKGKGNPCSGTEALYRPYGP